MRSSWATRRGPALWILGAVLLSLAACRNARAAGAAVPASPAPGADDREEIGWMVLDPGPRPSPSLEHTPPEELPRLYRSIYRVKPDRRALYAVAEVERLLSGRAKPATLSLRFEGREWLLSLEGKPVGRVPEFPRFGDWEKLLDAWTRRCAEDRGVRPGAASAVTDANFQKDLDGRAETLLDGLARLSAASAGKGFRPEPWRAAARAIAWLLLQTPDPVRVADPLAGHGLAVLAIARNLAGDSLPEETAWIAAALGYDSIAAQRSSEASALRLYASGDTSRLAALAHSPSPDAGAQYLYLLDLTRRGAKSVWFDELRKTPWVKSVDVSSLNLMLTLENFETADPAGRALASHAYLAVTSPKGASPDAGLWGPESWPDEALRGHLASTGEGPTPEGRSAEFERAVDQRARAAVGPFLDKESVRAFYRAAYYAGIHERARFLFDAYGSPQHGGRYAAAIADPARGTATELRDWMLLRAAGGRREGELPARLQRIDGLRNIGAEQIGKLVLPLIRDEIPVGTDPQRRSALAILFRRIDSRPGGARAASDAAYQLSDLRLYEALIRLGAEECPVRCAELAVQASALAGDVPGLRRIAADRRFSSWQRLKALGELERWKDADIPFLRDRFVELIDEEPEEYSAAWAGAARLASAGDPEAGVKLIDRWLERRPSKEHDLSWAGVIAKRAEILGDQKKWKEAWDTIEPAVPTWKGDVL